MSICTYRIVNQVNGRVYFGKTVDLRSRWYNHRYDARHGSDLPIHRAIRKYGIDNFKIELLNEHVDDAAASEHERSLIATIDPGTCYNVAKGGNGGHTMTSEQLNAQYAIGPRDYEAFLQMFHDGFSALEIARRFDVSYNAVRNCAARLGVSFHERRSRKKHPGARRCRNRSHVSRARMTLEERAMFRSKLMASLNRARGASEELKQQIVSLYFHGEQLTAHEIAHRLGINQTTVRSVVSAAYSKMQSDERSSMKKQRASSVRSGNRNANSLLRRKAAREAHP